MSWNKNTINHSHIDTIIEVLEELHISYGVVNMGKVLARGVNDDHNSIETYTMRELTYKDIIVLERMNRNSDCDGDDIISSYIYNIKEYATIMQDDKWEIEK